MCHQKHIVHQEMLGAKPAPCTNTSVFLILNLRQVFTTCLAFLIPLSLFLSVSLSLPAFICTSTLSALHSASASVMIPSGRLLHLHLPRSVMLLVGSAQDTMSSLPSPPFVTLLARHRLRQQDSRLCLCLMIGQWPRLPPSLPEWDVLEQYHLMCLFPH